MTVANWIELGLVAAVIVTVAVLVVRWASQSQAAAAAEKAAADAKAFDAQRAALLTPTPEQKVAQLNPDQTTDALNKL
jgi:hypothetical protein